MAEHKMQLGKTLQMKILFSLGLIIFIAIGINTLIHVRDLQQNYLEAIEWRSATLAQSLRADISSKYNFYGKLADMQLILEAAFLQCEKLYEANRNMHVSFVSVLNESGVIIAHNNKSLRNKQLNSPELLTSLRKRDMLTVVDKEYYHTLIPIMAENGVYLGTIDVGFPKNVVDEKIWNSFRKAIFLFLFVFLAAFFPVWFFVNRFVTSPIEELVEATSAIADGDLGRQIDMVHTSEFKILSVSLINMRDSIRESIDELTRLRLYLKNMFDSMPSVLVGVDSEGLVTQWNREAKQITGLHADAVQGKILSTALPQLKTQMEQIKTAISRKEPQFAQKVPRQVNGETRYSDIMIYPLISNGVEGAVIRVDDVTDRVRIEQMMVQTEKMMSVGGLAAGMAHEINNPLGAIMQGVQNAIRRVSPDLEANQKAAEECGTDLEAVRGYLEKRGILRYFDGMRDAGSRAAKIVANMLNFSRQSESKLSPIEINSLIDSVLELADSDYDLLKKYDFRHVEIVREYGADLSQVPCTSTEIEQVFLNLIRNAVEAMAENRGRKAGPRITIRTRMEKDHVLIEVEDNGSGMSDETRKRVFEPFFTTKDVGVGTGLGLSVSYFIITNNHNGTMSVESEPGNGAKFIIRLPLGKEQA